MKIMPGHILPINFSFWPAKSGEILMSLVVAVEGEIITLCPVHIEHDTAGFYDLIIPMADNSLGCNLVIMSEAMAGFTRNAIKPEVFAAAPDAAVQKCLDMPESERTRILGDLKYLQENSSPDKAFAVLRGDFLPGSSPQERWRKKLRRNWQSFREESLLEHVNQHLKVFPRYVGMESVIQKMAELKSGLETGNAGCPTMPLAANERLANAANARQRTNSLVKNPVISELRHNLGKALTDQPASPDLYARLLEGNTADLLELSIRLFHKR